MIGALIGNGHETAAKPRAAEAMPRLPGRNADRRDRAPRCLSMPALWRCRTNRQVGQGVTMDVRGMSAPGQRILVNLNC
jgi:hypothetical protein